MSHVTTFHRNPCCLGSQQRFVFAATELYIHTLCVNAYQIRHISVSPHSLSHLPNSHTPPLPPPPPPSCLSRASIYLEYFRTPCVCVCVCVCVCARARLCVSLCVRAWVLICFSHMHIHHHQHLRLIFRLAPSPPSITGPRSGPPVIDIVSE